MITVVNLKYEHYDIYIGRKYGESFHFGNPFTYIKNIPDTIYVASREISVMRFEQWLEGKIPVFEPRRDWILENLNLLKDKKLGCYCKPLECHGDILKKLVEKI